MQPEQQQRIMGYFIEEAKDHLNTIEQGLLSLQSTIEDPEMMNELFRAAHSVKGGAAMLGLNSIQQVSHRFEDSFKILKDSPVTADQKLESLFLRVFDALKELLEQLQGPFGLTGDAAHTALTEVEPVFGELEQHLNQLVEAAGHQPEVIAVQPSVSNYEAVASLDPQLAQCFSSEVPARLREMLRLFKQPEGDAFSRQQLREICQDLAELGQPFQLSAWSRLLETTQQAIAHPDNSYRTLAPIVIKDIKQAQDLVLAGRGDEIAACAQLQELVPTQVESVAIPASGFMPSSDDLLADLAATSAIAEPSLTFDLDQQAEPSLTFDLDQEFATSAERHGPEVGMAELNSLADLFEGEVPDLGSTWQEEEVLEVATHPLGLAATNTPDDDTTDFSDLLFGDTEPAVASAPDDLSDLFDEPLLVDGADSSIFDDHPPEIAATGDSLEDLLSLAEVDLGQNTTSTQSEQFLPDFADPFSSFDLDENVIDSPSATPEPALGELGDLFADMDGAELGLVESESLVQPGVLPSEVESDDPFALQRGVEPVSSENIAFADPWAELSEDAASSETPSVEVQPPTPGATDLGMDDAVALSDLFGSDPAIHLEESDDLAEIEELTDDDLDFSSLLNPSPSSASDLSTEPELELVNSSLDSDLDLSTDLWTDTPDAIAADAESWHDALELSSTSMAAADPTQEVTAPMEAELDLGLDDFELSNALEELPSPTNAGSLDLDLSDFNLDAVDGVDVGSASEAAAFNLDEFNLDSTSELDPEPVSEPDDFLGDLPLDAVLDLPLAESTDILSVPDTWISAEAGSEVFSAAIEPVEDPFAEDLASTLDPAAMADTAEAGAIADADWLSESLEDDLLADPLDSISLSNDFSDLDSLLAEESTPSSESLAQFDRLDDTPIANDLSDLDQLLSESVTADDFTNLEELTESTSNGTNDLENLLGAGLMSAAAAGALGAFDSDSTANDAASAPSLDDFSDLQALLGDESVEPDVDELVEPGSDTDFDELDDLLKDAEDKMGGSPSMAVSRSIISQNRRPIRPGRVFSEQTMRVPVKHLDNLSNLVGELVVNRNSLEQDQERLRQSLDNLLYQIQQLSDVGQRMQDLYERSLLESSLLASRQGYRQTSTDREIAAETITANLNGMDYDPLEMDRFTGFHSLSQEMIELIVRVRESSSDIEFIVDETDQVTRMFRQVTTQLQEGLTRSRMVPFAQTADRLPRAVRDIAMRVGKQAELVIEGRETLIDKMILEQLYDPMTHLVNNAITHGIEPPDVRRSLGKSATGRITVRAFHQGNQTIISVSDDGAGIDVERVKAKAVEKGLVTVAESQGLTRLDMYDLLFHPGFTTKDQADDFSGRGVGMDVVRTSLSEIRGAINTDSNPGRGTTFTIRLPLTLSISKALCCISDRARIAFPMDGVEDMLDVPKERIQLNAEGQACLYWRDALLPLHLLSELLSYNRHLSRGNVYGGNQEDDVYSIVVLRSAGNFLALQVDQVLGEQEIVIKQLEGPVPKPVGVAGATVLGDGRIMPIADVLELIDLAMGRIRKDSGGSLWEQDGATVIQDSVAAKTEPVVLIVDDSITVRELLSMTFNKVGYRVEQARDGQEAWEKLRSGMPCDIVFCDIEMPRMDGLELLSRIQKDPNLTALPIAMLTSRGADRHRQMASSLGASGYFTKPYLEEALLDAAQRMLKGEKLL